MCIQIVSNFGPLARKWRHFSCDNSPGEAGSPMKAILMQICKTHAQWIHCFEQSHQSYLPTGQWPGLNHLVFRVAKCLARGQKSNSNSIQKITTEHCLIFLYWCGWSICTIRMSPVNVLSPALRVKVIKELLEWEKHLLSRSVLQFVPHIWRPCENKCSLG